MLKSLTKFRICILLFSRASIILGLFLLPFTIYSNHLFNRSVAVRSDSTPQSFDLEPKNLSKLRPIGSNTTLASYKQAARLIWSSDEDAGVRLQRIVTLIYLQYDKSELINPWYQDWVAYLLSTTGLPKLRDLSSSIEPEDIASANNAFCSQLSILLMSILRDLKINYQPMRISIDNGKNGHFVTLASVSSALFLLDPHRNPPFDLSGESTLRLLSSESTLSAFREIYGSTGLNVNNVTLQLGDWNAFPAQNSRLIRMFTGNLSRFLWLYSIFVGIVGLFVLRYVKPFKSYVI
jgi:hypothetical protein